MGGIYDALGDLGRGPQMVHVEYLLQQQSITAFDSIVQSGNPLYLPEQVIEGHERLATGTVALSEEQQKKIGTITYEIEQGRFKLRRIIPSERTYAGFSIDGDLTQTDQVIRAHVAIVDAVKRANEDKERVRRNDDFVVISIDYRLAGLFLTFGYHSATLKEKPVQEELAQGNKPQKILMVGQLKELEQNPLFRNNPWELRALAGWLETVSTLDAGVSPAVPIGMGTKEIPAPYEFSAEMEAANADFERVQMNPSPELLGYIAGMRRAMSSLNTGYELQINLLDSPITTPMPLDGNHSLKYREEVSIEILITNTDEAPPRIVKRIRLDCKRRWAGSYEEEYGIARVVNKL